MTRQRGPIVRFVQCAAVFIPFVMLFCAISALSGIRRLREKCALRAIRG